MPDFDSDFEQPTFQGDRLALSLPRVLPWAKSFCPFRACGALPFRYAPVTVGSGRVGLTSEYAYPLDSIKEGADEPVANDTCDVTYESNPGDVLHIPAEGNLLQAHYYHTSGTTDNQH